MTSASLLHLLCAWGWRRGVHPTMWYLGPISGSFQGLLLVVPKRLYVVPGIEPRVCYIQGKYRNATLYSPSPTSSNLMYWSKFLMYCLKWIHTEWKGNLNLLVFVVIVGSALGSHCWWIWDLMELWGSNLGQLLVRQMPSSMLFFPSHDNFC